MPLGIVAAAIAVVLSISAQATVLNNASTAGQDVVQSSLLLQIEAGAEANSIHQQLGGSVNSQLTMTGGTIATHLYASVGGSSTQLVQISGGTIGGNLYASTGGSTTTTIEIYGGQIGGFVGNGSPGAGGVNATVRVFGSDFMFDGNAVAAGSVLTSSGLLTATLATGEVASIRFSRACDTGFWSFCFPGSELQGRLELVAAGFNDIPAHLRPPPAVPAPLAVSLLVPALLMLLSRRRA